MRVGACVAHTCSAHAPAPLLKTPALKHSAFSHPENESEGKFARWPHVPSSLGVAPALFDRHFLFLLACQTIKKRDMSEYMHAQHQHKIRPPRDAHPGGNVKLFDTNNSIVCLHSN